MSRRETSRLRIEEKEKPESVETIKVSTDERNRNRKGDSKKLTDSADQSIAVYLNKIHCN